MDGILRKCATYRLTPSGEVLQGWDHAPQHPEINPYPRHRPQGGAVHTSDVRTLEDVLATLSKILLS